MKGKTDLLVYLDANPSALHVVHNMPYHNRNKAKTSTSHEVEAPPTKGTLRSQKVAFRWKEMCLICGEAVDTVSGDQRKVVTFGVCIRLAEGCLTRGYDHWAMEVKG